MPPFPRLLVGALCALLLLPTFASANGNVHVSRFWHNHQPLYWPEWNSNGSQNQRGQYAWDSIVLKPGQNYGGLSPKQHPENNLTDIFGLDDRKNAYQSGPRNSLANVDSRGGFGVSYSGSLIDNVRQLGAGGQLGYQGNWNAGYREARGWKTPSGSTRMDMLGFTYHHSLGPLLPKSVFRKEIQAFKHAWWKAWGGSEDLSDHSKGFFPTEMGYSRHLIDVLVDEGFEWTLVASHHISRTSPSYNDKADPEGNFNIKSSPPNRADQISPRFDNASQWWFGEPNPGNAAWNVAPFAYQLHRVKYVNPETGEEKKMYAVPSDDVLSYRYGYANEGIGKIADHIAPHADRPVIVIPATDGDNAWGGGSSSWFEATPQLFSASAAQGYKPSAPQDFVNAAKAGVTGDTHIEDGAWIFPEMCYGSPNFLKWIEPPVATVANRGKTTHPGTQIDMETPGFALKFFSYAPLMAGANWLETAEQVLREEGGDVQAWKVAHPYNWDGSWAGANDVELAWHIYLKGLDSGFNYYGGLGNDDEVKPALATRNAVNRLQNFMTTARKAKDKTPPTVLKPQRFPYNPGAYTFGWFNNEPHLNNNNFLKKMPSWFYIWTHAYDINGIPEGNVKLKVRIDNDGANPLGSNQNETYAGGDEVGQWVTINMTKRVLPRTRTALNAAAANPGEIDYFVFDPSFWPEPVIADYYFAKIDDASLPGFRDKLLDYYIEATDALGNVHKSEIQHVWVANDGETPSSSAQFSANPNNCEPVTVTYSAANGPLEGVSPVYVQLRFNDGEWSRHLMTGSAADVWTYTFDAPAGATAASVWFENGDGSVIDSRNGANWTTTIRDCNAPDGPVWTVPFTPVAGQPVTIHYNPEGRNLASATAVNIHYGYNGANWTAVPGVAMTKSGSIWTYTYTVPAQATSLVMVFNNNAGAWDNNGGQNFTLAVSDEPAPTEPPPVPEGLSVSGVTGTSVTLVWNAAATATGYEVFRDGQQAGVTSSATFTDSGLQPEMTYSYRVLATNGAGASALTSAVGATTSSAPLGANQIVVLDPSAAGPATGSPYLFRGRAGSALTNGLAWTNPLTGSNGIIAFPGGQVNEGWEWTAGISLGAGANEVTFSGGYDITSVQTLTDSPANYSAWSNGSTGGTGFGAWSLTSSGNGGHFLANNPANMSVGATKGFGLWANTGGTATAARNFNTPMAAGDSFALRFDNNWIDTGGETGFALTDSAGAVRFRFYFVGGQSNYRITDATAARDSGLAYTGNGLNLTVTLNSSNAYTLSTGGTNITGTLAAAGGAISRLVVENKNAGLDTERNLYLGAMTHTRLLGEAGTVSATAPVLTLGGGPADFDEWRGDEPATDDLLLDYAIGGASAPGGTGEPAQVSRDGTHLLMTAVVRTGDSALVVAAEATGDLDGVWSPEGIEMTDHADQSGLPAGCVRKVVRVPLEGDRRFVRFRVTHTP